MTVGSIATADLPLTDTLAGLSVGSNANLNFASGIGLNVNAVTIGTGAQVWLSGGTLQTVGVYSSGSLVGYGTITGRVWGGSGTISASGGSLDINTDVSPETTLQIDATKRSTLRIDSVVETASAVSITDANQTLEIGANADLIIDETESITGGTIRLDGGTLTGEDSISVGVNAKIVGNGTIIGVVYGSGSPNNTGVVEASGGLLDLFWGVSDDASDLTFAIDAGAILQIEGGFKSGDSNFTFLGPTGELAFCDLAGSLSATITGLNVGTSATQPTNFVDFKDGVFITDCQYTGTDGVEVHLSDGSVLTLNGVTNTGLAPWYVCTQSDGGFGTEIFLSSSAPIYVPTKFYWDAPSGLWSVPTNWDQAVGVPGDATGDSAEIKPGKTATCDLPLQNLASLSVDTNASLDFATDIGLNVDGQVTIETGAQVSLSGGTLRLKQVDSQGSVTGSGTIIGAGWDGKGTICASGGTLYIDTAVTPNTTLQIGAGSILQLEGANIAKGEQFTFLGQSGELACNFAGSLSATITGLYVGTSATQPTNFLDFKNFWVTVRQIDPIGTDGVKIYLSDQSVLTLNGVINTNSAPWYVCTQSDGGIGTEIFLSNTAPVDLPSDFFWKAGSGQWSDPTNWSKSGLNQVSGVPGDGAGDFAVIVDGSTVTCDQPLSHELNQLFVEDNAHLDFAADIGLTVNMLTTLNGQVRLSGGTLSTPCSLSGCLIGYGTIIGSDWIGTGTICASGSTLDLATNVSPDITLEIGSTPESILQIEGDVASDDQSLSPLASLPSSFTFLGPSGELVFHHFAGPLSATITGLNVGTSPTQPTNFLDYKDHVVTITGTSAIGTDGVITLSDGSVLTLQGVTNAGSAPWDVCAESDGYNGTEIFLSSAPTVALSVASAEADEDSSVAITITGTPVVSDDTLTYTLSGIPTDATLSNVAGPLTVLDGSITLTQDQLTGLSLQLGETDANLWVTATEVTVTAPASTPATATIKVTHLAEIPMVALSVASATVTTGGSDAITIIGTPVDSDDTLTYTLSGIPADATLKDKAGALTVIGGSITLTQAELDGLTLQLGATNANLSVTATASEGTSTSPPSTPATASIAVMLGTATAPTVTGVTASPADAILGAGATATLTVTMNEAVTVIGGPPILTLNNGAVATYTSGSGTNALTFSYTVAPNQDITDLAVTGVNVNGASVHNQAGTAADFTNAVTNPAGWLQIAPSAIEAFDTTTQTPVPVVADHYNGPVADLQGEYITITSDGLNITASSPNWFIHSGSGMDAIAVSSGTNVLDGGTGSNFLVGGTGNDTFFVDDRGAPADIWSTVVGFHPDDAATVWGVTRQDFHLDWVNGQGAIGYTGLTLHATAPGTPTASLTLTGYTQADLTNGRLSVQFGTDPASGSAYMYIHGNA
jgi:hypothetical protein